MRKFITSLAAASGLAVASPALAATFDVVTGYNTAPFTYGTGFGGSTFSAFTLNFASGCLLQAAITCRSNASSGSLPIVARNTGTTTFTFLTASLPNNALILHPGFSAGEDAIVRFTAAAADTYTLNGNFIRLDSVLTPSGRQDGILGSVYKVSGSTFTSLYSDVLVGGLSSSISFTGLSTALAAGDHIDFVVNKRTFFNNDMTGLQATITTSAISAAVPEPATWAMMLFGFGLVGSTMRRRTVTRVSATV